MAVLVDLAGVGASRPNRPLFGDLSVTVADGDRLGVIGINGTGKSTLLRVIAGVEAPETGTVRRGRGVRVGFLDQDAPLPEGRVGDVVGAGWEAAAVLDRLGMGGMTGASTAELSGGQAKRVALARVLATECELLVLDEPTNQLDVATVAWLEGWLATFRGGLVLVTHDRHLLDRVTTRMLELDRGRAYVHDGGYASYLGAVVEREERAAAAEVTRRNLARRELAWLRRGAPARTRKSKARIDSATAIVEGRPEAAARSGELGLGAGFGARPATRGDGQRSAGSGNRVVRANELGRVWGTPRLGDKVFELRGIRFAYPSGPPVLDGVDLLLGPGERVGIVGPNGTGKSTLLDLLAGRSQPTEGTVEAGPTVVVGYYDQLGATLDPDARVRDLVAGPTRAPGAPEDLALMERFWFGGELQFARVAALSGGERRRLQLLLVLAGRPNVVLLDEPTNDLDLDTLRALEAFLDDWPGTAVMVSHDRTFLDRCVERLLALGDGRLAEVAGGVAAWVAEAERARPAAAVPASAPAAPLAPSPRRPSGKVGQLLREADREVARLTRRREQLLEKFNAAGGPEDLQRVGDDLGRVSAELADAEERWLALAEEAESS